ncbi:MAG TPA: hypothetical protein VF862_00075 [Gemmatimonadales bacterium]
MNRPARVAVAIAVITCGSAIAQGLWNQSGSDSTSVTLVLGREAKLVSGGTRNSATSVRLWLGPEGAISAPLTTRAWLDTLGFGPPGEVSTVRRAFAVLDAGTEANPGAEGLSVVEIGRDAGGLMERYPDRARYLIAPVRVRQWGRRGRPDSLGMVMLARDLLHVPSGLEVGGRVSVRTGRSGIPYVAAGR